MAKEHESSDNQSGAINKRPILRKAAIAGFALAIFIGIFSVAVLVWNNVSVVSDAAFAKRVDAAMELAEKWVEHHKMDILKRKNIALLKMLSECDELKANAVFKEIIGNFLAVKSRPECWKRLIDPNWPVDELELNRTIEKEYIDNKWVLYAIAPDKAKITPEELHLFDPKRWKQRQLTHQLNALVRFKKAKKADEELDKLIEHLCDRLSGELVFDVPVVDIYIQKVTFVLRAGFPEKIRPRWVERIIANQLPDGGWNDRWFCFTSNRRPMLDFGTPPSNQHAAVQALTALYLVKYRYPEHFNLK
ncbi:MAG: hypothetical protein ACYS0C_07190 [Planctomycetota bacterium]|jgi:hypothetical protein